MNENPAENVFEIYIYSELVKALIIDCKYCREQKAESSPDNIIPPQFLRGVRERLKQKQSGLV